MSVHHTTIRKYTSALMNIFNDIEIQYPNSLGNIITKSIPIRYSTREKARIFDQYTTEQLLSGNYNVLPRANLALSTVVKSDQRVTNKNLKINTKITAETIEYMYNSVPYEFTYELTIMCRGMNEVAMIIEQIAPKFNPVLNVDVWDAQNLDEPTRVPVKLLDIGIENDEYDELSSNIFSVSFGLSIMGNLYQPIKLIQRIKEFKILINEQKQDKFIRKTILGWDVDDDGVLENGTTVNVQDTVTYPPTIIDIIGTNLVQGTNTLEVIYEDKDNKLTELAFVWVVLSGDATIVGDLNLSTLTVNSAGSVDVEVTITDIYGNFTSLNKVFSIS